MTAKDRCRLRAKQRGVAIVEFAVALPLLIFILIAVVEMGTALHEYNTVAKAVRDGARFLATNVYDGDGTEFSNSARDAANRLVQCGRTDCTGAPDLVAGVSTVEVYAGTYGGGQDTNAASLSCDDLQPGDSADNRTVLVCADYTFSLAVLGNLQVLNLTVPIRSYMGVP